ITADPAPIAASFFSLTTEFVTPEQAKAFLAAVRAASPKRDLVVLADSKIRSALPDDPSTHVIDSGSHRFTPWVRDPFLLARTGDGVVVFVDRPNIQPKREADALLARTIVARIPPSLEAKWKRTRWTVAPVPFHNGHVLLTPGAAWISMHTVEIRALEILDLGRVPVDTFRTVAGIQRYIEAVKRAAAELETLFGRPVRFVHPLPSGDSLEQQIQLMQVLAGGAGFDLDSLVTLLPQRDGSTRALVGDVRLGSRMAKDAKLEDLQRLHRSYGFAGPASTLGKRITEAHDVPGTIGLQLFLDLVAFHLGGERLPLLNIPYSLLADRSGLSGSQFLLTWNNVVLEEGRAEGFASLFAPADAYARQAFSDAGYRLELYAPLVRSVLLNGGYRCSSNHLR
ncbi:MAG TPA: hypothetical protein VMT00_03630, partial [Thermoanaerobaculia bacterium]|nr:hypothetical protein [Thermoanaerobaculia bacterium]